MGVAPPDPPTLVAQASSLCSELLGRESGAPPPFSLWHYSISKPRTLSFAAHSSIFLFIDSQCFSTLPNLSPPVLS
jgi:hypothetical protein